MKIISRKEAKALGLKRYFTGEPCKHGHVCERYCASGCIECRIRDTIKWKSSHKKETEEYNRRYNHKHRERRINKDRDRYIRNIHAMREKARERSAKLQASYKCLKQLGIQI